MGAKSRRKGANAERAVVHAAEAAGISSLRVIRTATSTEPDHGDVHIGNHIVAQVKAGNAAKTAGVATLADWWAETQAQAWRVAEHRGYEHIPLLVRQVHGSTATRAEDWSATCWLSDYLLLADEGLPHPPDTVITVSFAQFLTTATENR